MSALMAAPTPHTSSGNAHSPLTLNVWSSRAMMKRIPVYALVAGILLALMGATCNSGGTTSPTGGGGAKVAAATINIRLHVLWKAHAAGGTIEVSWSDPESSDRRSFAARSAGKFAHDATIPPGDGIVATVHQTTGGTLQCWVVEVSSKGVEGATLLPVQTTTAPGMAHALQCDYHNEGHVD